MTMPTEIGIDNFNKVRYTLSWGNVAKIHFDVLLDSCDISIESDLYFNLRIPSENGLMELSFFPNNIYTMKVQPARDIWKSLRKMGYNHKSH